MRRFVTVPASRPRLESSPGRRGWNVRRASVGVELRGDELVIACVRPGLRKRWMTASGRIAGFAQLAAEELRARVSEITGALDDPIVTLGLPRRDVMQRHLQLPAAAEKQLASVLELQLGLYKPNDDEEYCWDAAVARGARSESRSEGEQLAIALAFLSRARVEDLCAQFRAAGLPLARITVTQMAVLDWALRGGTSDSRLLLAEARGSEADIAVVEDGRCLATRSFALARDGAAAQVALQARQAIAAARTGAGAWRVLLGGQGATVWREPLSEFGETQELESFLATDVAATADAALGRDVLGAAALALAGFRGSGNYQLNLLPRELRARPQRWRNTPTYTLLALNVLLLVALVARRPLQQQVLLRRYQQELTSLERPASLIERELKKTERLEQRLGTLADFQQHGRQPLDALGEIAQKLPPDAWVSGFTCRNGQVDISGTAKAASAVLPALQASTQFDDVQFRGGLTREGGGAERFQIQMKLRAGR
jgi:Tfp pilus assembly protein PilN